MTIPALRHLPFNTIKIKMKNPSWILLILFVIIQIGCTTDSPNPIEIMEEVFYDNEIKRIQPLESKTDWMGYMDSVNLKYLMRNYLNDFICLVFGEKQYSVYSYIGINL